LFLRLFKRPEIRNIFSGTVCFGDGFFAGKSMKFGSGTFFDTLTGSFGCDSVVIYSQTERARDTGAVSFSICAGDSVFSGNTWKKAAGTYRETLNNRFGCDSAVTSRISVRPTSFTAIKDTICFGSAYNFLGTAISDPGIYRKVLVNHVGCDSVVELNLFRRAQFIPKVITLNFARLTTEKPYSAYQWFVNRTLLNGETNRVITVSSNGIYDVSVTDSLGCSANSWDDLLRNGDDLKFDNIALFPNPVSQELTIVCHSRVEMLLYNSAGKLIRTEFLPTGQSKISVQEWSEGLYNVVLKRNNQLFSAKIVVIH
jgi:hypothetical protein